MKITLLLAAVLVVPHLGWGQGALHTDPAGNPVTSLNVGGGNVTGTLAAERLPAGARPPVVQTVTATAGGATLAAGTNVAVLGATRTGTLNLTLPASSSYAAGRTLVVVDPGGDSNDDRTVTVAPAAGDTLNGGTTALTCLTGTGTANLYPDGTTHWAVGQSFLRAPDSHGLTLTAPTSAASGRLLSVRNAAGAEAFAVLGNGGSETRQLSVEESFYSDDGGLYTDGMANLVSGNSITSPVISISGIIDPVEITVPPGQLSLYLGEDGRLHCLTDDRVDHVLTWTTP